MWFYETCLFDDLLMIISYCDAPWCIWCYSLIVLIGTCQLFDPSSWLSSKIIFRLLPRVAEKVFQNGKVDKLTWEWVSIFNNIRTEDIVHIGLVLGVAEKNLFVSGADTSSHFSMDSFNGVNSVKFLRINSSIKKIRLECLHHPTQFSSSTHYGL